MSESKLQELNEWWKTNSLWLEKYIKADPNTSWDEKDKAMIDVVTCLIKKSIELFPEDWMKWEGKA